MILYDSPKIQLLLIVLNQITKIRLADKFDSIQLIKSSIESNLSINRILTDKFDSIQLINSSVKLHKSTIFINNSKFSSTTLILYNLDESIDKHK